jgi:hypothetical protein
MLERFREELRAIQSWPCGKMLTETEEDAVAIRALRALELENKIRDIALSN